MSADLFSGNTKKTPKKSMFYIKAIDKHAPPELSTLKIFSKLSEDKLKELEAEETELSDFANLHGISTYRPLEIQQYMFTNEDREECFGTAEYKEKPNLSDLSKQAISHYFSKHTLTFLYSRAGF